MPKYMRIQGREIAFKTGKPAGLFALCWRRIRDGIFSAEDEAAFRAEDEWFRANLPVPPFYEDNKMVGYVSLAKQPEGHYDLNNLAVLPENRHCAYGGRLVDFCKQKVKELGADKIRIGIIEESWIIKNFYEYHGFVHTGTEKYNHLPFTVGRMEWTVKENPDF